MKLLVVLYSDGMGKSVSYLDTQTPMAPEPVATNQNTETTEDWRWSDSFHSTGTTSVVKMGLSAIWKCILIYDCWLRLLLDPM
jgi:hypothetical protein